MAKRVRGRDRLRVNDIERLPEGYHEDGGGLRLVVEPKESRHWVLRITINGQRRSIGLGPYPDLTLDAARDLAIDHRRAARQGIDLREEKKRQAALAMTFRQAFAVFFENKRKELDGSRHLMQWTSQMRDYVFPIIGGKPVSEVTQADVLQVLKPIWYEKPETAKRVLQRMTLVFKSAIFRGFRERANPCDGVAQELGRRHQKVEHHRALPYTEVAGFIRKLRGTQARLATKLAFEWLILTATRSGETRRAVWSEIDERQARWAIPAERMKMSRPHIVPLPRRCLKILRELRTAYPSQPGDLLFPGQKRGSPISDMTMTKILRDQDLADRATVHGFRSAFKDWCAEIAKAPDEVSEAALAHMVAGKVRAAYLRTAFFEERVGLMKRWAVYCAS
jgi:integrase